MKIRDKMTYLDNGATSYPKPSGVIEAYCDYAKNIGASPARGTYETAEIAEKSIEHTRENIAKLFGAKNPGRIAFTKSATESLNLALFGLLKPGDKVITTRMEHNAVTRPLIELERRGDIEILSAQVTPRGRLDIEHLYELAEKPRVRMIVTTGIANSTGVINPFWEIGEFCRKKEIIYAIDGAQLCGVYPVNVEEDFVDILVFTGHKGLYGVPGTGGLYISEHLGNRIKPLLYGGTGAQSDRTTMPSVLPDRYEAGTPNTPGIIALGTGVQWVLDKGVDEIHRHKQKLLQLMMELLQDAPGIRLFGPQTDLDRTAIVPLVIEDMNPKEAAEQLWVKYKIATRAGCHCAPQVHFDLGAPQGTLRFSFGAFNTVEDAEYAAEAIIEIAKK